LVGADIGFASDLPPAAGMSSSSALMVASFLALSALNDLAEREEYQRQISDKETLAGYLGTIENGMSFGSFEGDRGVGTFGGSEDHTAILCAQPARMVQYSYCPVRFERTVQLPADHVIAVGVSGVVADKTGSAMEKYNRVSELARAVGEVWCQASGRHDPHIAAALASAPDAAERIRETLRSSHHGKYSPAQLLDRFEQFLAESEQVIPAVPDRLEGPALSGLGSLVDRSQSLGARLLGNQTPETIWLAERARSLGAAAASSFGAGFGGSVWALVRTDDAPRILEAWAAGYRESFPHVSALSSFFTTSAGPPAFRLDGAEE
jgi:galactokinase